MNRTKVIFLIIIMLRGYSYSQANYKSYQNYEFVPGEKVLFEDNSNTGSDINSFWNVKGGEVSLTKSGDENAVSIAKYYTILEPRTVSGFQLGDDYTIEFDSWLDAGYSGNGGVFINFKNGDENLGTINVFSDYTPCDFPNGKSRGEHPLDIKAEKYYDKWHHYTISIKNKNIKVYVDQYKVLEVPDCGFSASSIEVCGNSSEGLLMQYKNFRIAAGTDYNDKANIITHINFEKNKSTIKPESAGLINMIDGLMKNDASLKYEIGGYTDGDGSADANQKLSQQRAEEVRSRLIALGIDGTRLVAKGYGKNNPVADNNTTEGKANNRRVEFKKI